VFITRGNTLDPCDARPVLPERMFSVACDVANGSLKLELGALPASLTWDWKRDCYRPLLSDSYMSRCVAAIVRNTYSERDTDHKPGYQLVLRHPTLASSQPGPWVSGSRAHSSPNSSDVRVRQPASAGEWVRTSPITPLP